MNLKVSIILKIFFFISAFWLYGQNHSENKFIKINIKSYSALNRQFTELKLPPLNLENVNEKLFADKNAGFIAKNKPIAFYALISSKKSFALDFLLYIPLKNDFFMPEKKISKVHDQDKQIYVSEKKYFRIINKYLAVSDLPSLLFDDIGLPAPKYNPDIKSPVFDIAVNFKILRKTFPEELKTSGILKKLENRSKIFRNVIDYFQKKADDLHIALYEDKKFYILYSEISPFSTEKKNSAKLQKLPDRTFLDFSFAFSPSESADYMDDVFELVSENILRTLRKNQESEKCQEYKNKISKLLSPLRKLNGFSMGISGKKPLRRSIIYLSAELAEKIDFQKKIKKIINETNKIDTIDKKIEIFKLSRYLSPKKKVINRVSFFSNDIEIFFMDFFQKDKLVFLTFSNQPDDRISEFIDNKTINRTDGFNGKIKFFSLMKYLISQGTVFYGISDTDSNFLLDSTLGQIIRINTFYQNKKLISEIRFRKTFIYPILIAVNISETVEKVKNSEFLKKTMKIYDKQKNMTFDFLKKGSDYYWKTHNSGKKILIKAFRKYTNREEKKSKNSKLKNQEQKDLK